MIRQRDPPGVLLTFWAEVLGLEVFRRFALDGGFAASVTGVGGAVIEAAVVWLGDIDVELLELVEPAG